MNKGQFIISLDFELIWGLAGWSTEKIDTYNKNISNATIALEKIIELFHKYDIKCTIAFVGAMNYRSLNELVTKLKKYKKPTYKKSIFYSFESLLPYIQQNRYPISNYFCKDIIENLKKNSKVELASHTFSHYYCLEEGQTAEDFKQDVSFAVMEAKKNDITIKSIIFPRNQVSQEYIDICKQLGITHYRGTLNNYLYQANKTESRYSIKGALRFLDTYFNLSGYNTYCNDYQRDGIHDVPGSRFLRPYSNSLSFLEYFKIRRIKRSMEYAAKNNEIYHLWWHPHNFGINMNENIANLELICKHYKYLNNKYNFISTFISEI